MIIKQNDTYPPLTATLTDGYGNAIDLTDATVTLYMVNAAGVVVIDGNPVTVTNPSSGVVEYEWGVGETSVPGEYLAEFKVEFVGLQVARFQNDSFVMIRIIKNLEPVAP
jgi:uncharacterized protein YfaS (alpha-2-macroglobulin family)